MPKRVTSTPFPADSMVTSSDTMGRAIRAVRTANQMTIEDAATMLGMAKQTLQDIELGKGSPSLDRVLHVAQAFGLTLFAVRPQNVTAVQSLLRKPSDAP